MHMEYPENRVPNQYLIIRKTFLFQESKLRLEHVKVDGPLSLNQYPVNEHIFGIRTLLERKELRLTGRSGCFEDGKDF
jgi:hypothetical protein